MHMKKVLLTIALTLICLSQIKAVPAYPRQVKMMINGKEVFVKLFGDEHAKRVETQEGYTIVQNDREEWVYAVLDANDCLSPSTYQVGSASPELAEWKSSLPLHLSGKRVSVPKARKQTTYRAPQQPAIGQRRILVILMEFPDNKFVKSAEDFDHLFNQPDYNDDNAQGSVRDYFFRSSYGQLLLSCDVYGPYQTAQRMSHYGKNSGLNGDDKAPEEMFEEAIKKVAEEVDLRAYDGDNDGYIDNVHIIYAGYGEEAGGPSDAIWAHEATFYEPYAIQGLNIDRYSCASELRDNRGEGISRIGPHCHEIGHALGAMDYYDTDYTDGGEYEGTGDWDIMASGSWNNDGITPADLNPYVKAFNYGWIEPRILPEGEVLLPPSDTDKDSYYIISHGKECYLLENRNPKAFNDGLPGKGLLIYHVHADLEDAENEINASSPQMCYIVCAAATKEKPGNSAKDYGDISSDKCPFPGSSNKTEFSTASVPKAFWWDGGDCDIAIHNIRMTADGSISLNSDNEGSVVPVDMDETELYFDGFETEKEYEFPSSDYYVWERVKGDEMWDMMMGRPSPYEGQYSLQLSGSGSWRSAVSTFGFHCLASSEAIEIRLSGFFTSKGIHRRQTNHLKVGWCPKGSDNWDYYDYEIAVEGIWTPFSLNIPPSSELEFSFEGTAQRGSTLALDNLKVEQVIATGVDRPELAPATTVTEIYSLSGQKRPHLEKGLNIVRFSDGNVKKIIIK